MRWIDEEGDEDLADSGLSLVFETERLNLVLVAFGNEMQRPWTVSTLPSSCKQLLSLVGTGGDSFIEFVDSGEGERSYRSIS